MPITINGWKNVYLYSLGLRSASNETDATGASYAMNCGVPVSFLIPAIPNGWDESLSATIRTIKSFVNASNRQLLLTRGSTGSAYEYTGCFPKCSSSGGITIIASTPLTGTENELINWVLERVEQYQDAQ